MAILAVVGGLSFFLPPFLSVGLLAVLLVALVASFLQRESRTIIQEGVRWRT